VVKNAIKINPGKSKALSITTARVKDPLHYFLGDQRISEASNCKYLGVILRSVLSWADQVIYTAQKKPGRHIILQYVFSKREIAIRKL
jgi:hypothetical protein